MLELPDNILNFIRNKAESAYPSECCGLLVGSIGKVARIVPSPNVMAHEGNDVFEIDPQVRFDLERELRGKVEKIIGHYHSHPDHPAVPSPMDIQRAFEPGLTWLIIPVEQGRAGEPRAFRIEAGQVTELRTCG